MKSYFASPERAAPGQLEKDIEFVTQNAVITGLLTAASGLLAVLNEHRQILAVNDAFLKSLGIEDPRQVTGLRPGEAVACVHAQDMPGGCGTSRFCPSCGAAVAIVASLTGDSAQEQKCAVHVKQDGTEKDLYLRVRACGIKFDERRYILVFLQDISAAERWAAWEQVYFHDLSNLVMVLSNSVENALEAGPDTVQEHLHQVARATARLQAEIAVQCVLLRDEMPEYALRLDKLTVTRVFSELKGLFASSSAAKGRRFVVRVPLPDITFSSDLALLLRVLTNMLKNAFEASPEGAEVRLWAERHKDSLKFCVHNQQRIEDYVAERLFQRNFTTKDETGRGLGTYAMKLLGEHFLKGAVGYEISQDGTTFYLELRCP